MRVVAMILPFLLISCMQDVIGRTNIYDPSNPNFISGKYWFQSTAAAGFSTRNSQSSVVYNEKMWVIGGTNAGAGYRDDVWYSSDGVSWTQATAAAGFSARCYHASVVYNNRMWVVGGHDGVNKNDVWYSSDGISWA